MIDSEDGARAFVAERCTPDRFALIERFVAALCEENARQNLVSAKSLDNIWQRHIADSAQLLDHVPRETSPWFDLGTGPGLPGLVLAIMRPQIDFILVESRRKRVDWLQWAASEFKLANVQIEGRRLELIEPFDVGVVTARAFAPLPRLLDLSSGFSTADTIWVLPKGRSAAQELATLPASQRKLFHVEQSQTDHDAGILVGKLA